MHHLRVVAIVVLAVLLAALPTLHHHSLIPEGHGALSPLCSVCAFGADRHAFELPLFAAALILLGSVLTAADVPSVSAVRLTRSGRAPPRSRR
jgi:hypothetical protein